jgi:lipid-binding SYLF domain-containing protein
LGGERFGFLLGVEVTEMQVAGAARSAALAAIGEGEGTQVGGTVLLRFARGTAVFMSGCKADFFICGRRTSSIMRGRKAANGAVRGHGNLLKS